MSCGQPRQFGTVTWDFRYVLWSTASVRYGNLGFPMFCGQPRQYSTVTWDFQCPAWSTASVRYGNLGFPMSCRDFPFMWSTASARYGNLGFPMSCGQPRHYGTVTWDFQCPVVNRVSTQYGAVLVTWDFQCPVVVLWWSCGGPGWGGPVVVLWYTGTYIP